MPNPSRPKILLALDYYDYRIHRGVARVAAQQGWSLMCTQSSVGVSAVPEGWSGQGVISLMSHPKTIETLATFTVPIVDIGLAPLPFQVSRVVTDNKAIGTAAAEHFLHKGFRSFLVLGVDQINNMFGERQESYMATLLKFPKKLLLNVIDERADRIQWEDQLRKCPKPLAIFGYVDGVALNILDMALEFGYAIPDEIAILGVDNNDLACEGVDIPLSSIDSDQVGLGEKAAQWLVQHMQGVPYSPQIHRHPILGVAIRKSSDILASSQPKVLKALQIIQSEYASDLTASSLAKRLHMTSQGLQQLFKEHDGRSPGQIIRMVKLQKAKDMLLNTESKLSAISQNCGYASVDAFCRSFRQNLGVSPTQWRKNHS